MARTERAFAGGLRVGLRREEPEEKSQATTKEQAYNIYAG
jgi:hypothetical protein